MVLPSNENVPYYSVQSRYILPPWWIVVCDTRGSSSRRALPCNIYIYIYIIIYIYVCILYILRVSSRVV